MVLEDAYELFAIARSRLQNALAEKYREGSYVLFNLRSNQKIPSSGTVVCIPLGSDGTVRIRLNSPKQKVVDVPWKQIL